MAKTLKYSRKFKLLQNKIANLTNDSRDRYYIRISNKLNESHVTSKVYWLILKMFLKNKKTPNILPLLYQNRFVTDSKKQAELFNSFFAKQYTAINNGSSLSSELLLKTDKYLFNITYSSDDILKIIQNIDSRKVHGYDRISIRMLKICGPSICTPLEINFKSCLENGVFPLEWKKTNIVPVHQKNGKQSLENYW